MFSQFEEVFRPSGLCEFHSCIICREVSHQWRSEGGTMRGRNHWGADAEKSQQCRKLFLQCSLLPKYLKFKYGGAKLVSCRRRNLTSVSPFVTPRTLQKSHLWRLHLSWYSFGHYPKFMTIGKDRNKDRFKNWQLCDVWKLPFCDYRPIKLTQNCVSFTNPCINLLPPLLNTTHRYLNFSTLGTWTSPPHLPHTLPWFCRETYSVPRYFSHANRKPI